MKILRASLICSGSNVQDLLHSQSMSEQIRKALTAKITFTFDSHRLQIKMMSRFPNSNNLRQSKFYQISDSENLKLSLILLFLYN